MRLTARPGRRTRAQGGFTLVELLVAGLVASVVMAAMYITYTQSVHSYRVQNDVLDTYGRLRFGLDHLTADIRRAGYGATLNSAIDPFIRPPAPPVPLRALTILRDFPGGVPESANQNVRPSALVLFGDYFSPVVFPATGSAALPTGVTYPVANVDGTVFSLDAGGVGIGQDEFLAAFFPAGNANARLLHVEHRSEGTHYYFPIADADYANLTVTVSAIVPSALTSGVYKSIYVNPVGTVRYRIATDERPLGPLDSNGNAQVQEGKTDLVREEVPWNDIQGDAIAGTRLVIVENAVDLQVYDFIFDNSAVGQAPILAVSHFVHDVVDGSGAGLLGTGLLAQPEDLRFLTVKLSVRTADEDPELRFKPREGDYAPLRTYELYTDLTGAARVESMAVRTQLANATLRNMK